MPKIFGEQKLNRFPAFFISHGAPNLILQPKDATVKFLQKLGREITEQHKTNGTPLKGILMISAHWEESSFTVSTCENPETIYDFYGFEPEMYKIMYPATGNSELSNRVVSLLKSSNITIKTDSKRGYDHGAWMPLKLMFPEANFPLVQLSLRNSLNPKEHMQVGQALTPLRDEGYLIIASGGAVHNLRARTVLEQWATEFQNWLDDTLVNNEKDERNQMLAGFDEQKSGKLAHPRAEHFIPIAVVAGLGGKATKLHGDWTWGSLSMASYSFE